MAPRNTPDPYDVDDALRTAEKTAEAARLAGADDPDRLRAAEKLAAAHEKPAAPPVEVEAAAAPKAKRR